MEPQSNIFHWAPLQEDTSVKIIDVDGFKKVSGIPVDYILLWGDLKGAPEGQTHQVVNAISQFNVVYRSPNSLVTLYGRRQRNQSSLCVAPES
jgi:hypothetical protein